MDECKACLGFQHMVNIPNAEGECNDHDKARRSVEDKRPDHAKGENSRCVTDLFGCSPHQLSIICGGSEFTPTHVDG